MQKLQEKLIQQVAKAGAYAPTGMGTDRASFKNAGICDTKANPGILLPEGIFTADLSALDYPRFSGWSPTLPSDPLRFFLETVLLPVFFAPGLSKALFCRLLV